MLKRVSQFRLAPLSICFKFFFVQAFKFQLSFIGVALLYILSMWNLPTLCVRWCTRKNWVASI